MNPTVVVPTNGVEGDITSCKIENQLLSIRRDKITALREYKTYVSYDVCSKKIISTYEVPEMTGYAVLLGLGIGVIVVVVMMFISAMFSPDPYRHLYP
jgi:hypothetical protein